MKHTYIFIVASILIGMFCYGCYDNRKANFYKAQPRDPDLIGWWQEAESDRYCEYSDNGHIYDAVRLVDGSLSGKVQGGLWYTKEGKI